MKNNFDSNARKAVHQWLDENWTNGKELMKKTFTYLNDNFNPGNGVKWNVVVVDTEKRLNYVNPDLISKSKNWMTIFVDYGKLTKPFRCDESYYQFIRNEVKHLQCIKINGNQASWSLNTAKPDYWDSHQFDGYVDGPRDHIIDDYVPPQPIIVG